MTRVLVCGGRGYGEVPRDCPLDQLDFERARAAKEVARLFQVLDAAVSRLRLTLLIHGGAFGADRNAGSSAKARGIAMQIYQAEWSADVERAGAVVRVNSRGNRYDAAAGARRNQQMIDEGKPEVCIAFPGGSGTRDMVSRATKAGVRVIKVDW
ncbi:SLOG family protein [Kaistia sp. MMO-174]|uniref:SLOG family protein n=1 Tax=Kaistia sp. MMO-174 TaxID=3081256 RepID=UPI0030197115